MKKYEYIKTLAEIRDEIAKALNELDCPVYVTNCTKCKYRDICKEMIEAQDRITNAISYVMEYKEGKIGY